MPLPNEASLLEEIRSLPDERIGEVEDFVDFLRQTTEDQRIATAATKLSDNAFANVWNNPSDAAYDDI